MSKKPSKFWTYDAQTNKLLQRSLFHKSTDQENWYEDAEGNSFEPFYVDLNKESLKNRVLDSLDAKCADLNSQIFKLASKALELTNR